MPEVRRYLIGKECSVESHEELIRYLGNNPREFPTRDVPRRIAWDIPNPSKSISRHLYKYRYI